MGSNPTLSAKLSEQRFKRFALGIQMSALIAGVLMCLVIELGTTAVALWTPGRVLMGADGKFSRRNDANVLAYEGCKVRIVRPYLFTAAGFYGREGGPFDVWLQMEGILSSSSSLAEIERRIRREMAPSLAEALGNARRVDPSRFAKDFKADFLALAVASIQGGKVAMMTLDFFPDGPNGMSAETHWYPPTGTLVGREDIGLSVMGERSAIDRDFPVARLVPLLRRDPAATIRTLIDLQVRESPDKVGPPLALAELTANGPRWIERGACGARREAEPWERIE